MFLRDILGCGNTKRVIRRFWNCKPSNPCDFSVAYRERVVLRTRPLYDLAEEPCMLMGGEHTRAARNIHC